MAKPFTKLEKINTSTAGQPVEVPSGIDIGPVMQAGRNSVETAVETLPQAEVFTILQAAFSKEGQRFPMSEVVQNPSVPTDGRFMFIKYLRTK